MFFKMFIFCFFTTISLIANENFSLKEILQLLNNGNYSERKKAVKSFNNLSEADLKLLIEKLQQSSDPELKKVLEDNFIKSHYIFYGELGIYKAHLVMTISIKGTLVSGSYYYSRHQKNLILKGSYDPRTGIIKMTETYEGNTTGCFEGSIKENVFQGIWKESLSSNSSHKFRFYKIHTLKEDRRFLKYSQSFDLIVAGDPKVYKGKTWLNVNKINDSQFSFYYKVNGDNGHTGSMQGIASFTKPNLAVFRNQEGAELVFYFGKNSVGIIPNKKCEDYCSAKTTFKWNLFKEK